MPIARVTVAGIDEKGNLIAKEDYQNKSIYVNSAEEGETVVAKLIDRGEYIFAEAVDEFRTDNVITLSESSGKSSNQSPFRLRASNQEPMARCPVAGCSEERLTRGMALHVYNSAGGGHGENGQIPSNIRFDNLEIVGSSSVEVGSGIEIGSSRVRVRCPSCKFVLPEERNFMNHLEEVVETGDRSGEMEVKVPTVWIDDRGAAYRIFEEFGLLFDDVYIEKKANDIDLNLDWSITERTNMVPSLSTDCYAGEGINWHNQIENMINERPELTEQSVERDTTDRVVRDTAFADLVKRAYDYSCAVCGQSRRGPSGQPEVEAAHIYPKSQQGSDDIRNALSLCKLHHWAFDIGWFSITPDLRVEINGNPTKGGFAELNQYRNMPIRTPPISGAEPHRLYIDAQRSDQL